VIADVCLNGPGHYLGSGQTLDLMQKEYIYPQVGNRMSPKEWNEAGKPDLIEVASRRKHKVLSGYFPDYLPDDVDKAIRANHKILLDRSLMQPGHKRFA
jgi:trimethylamine--corrinoid protein Co-methyltransferase